MTDCHGRQPHLRERESDRVVLARGHDDRPVDEAAAQEVGHTSGIPVRPDDETHQLVVVFRQPLVGAQQDRPDVRVLEEDRVRFVHDEPDGAGALGSQVPRRHIADVSHLGDGGLDGLPRRLRHVTLAIEKAGHRAA